jgi:hypothetical protein
MIKGSRFLGKFLKMSLAALSICLLTSVIAFQIDNRRLRHRAEQLIADFGMLNVDESTLTDVLRFHSRWRGEIYDGKACEESHCTLYFSQDSYIVGHTTKYMPQGMYDRAPIWRILLLLGARPASIQVWLEIRDGKLSSKMLKLYVEAPPKSFEEQILVGQLSANNANSKPVSPSSHVIVDCGVGSTTFHPLLDTGGGVSSPTIFVQCKPNGKEKMRQLAHFNLDCLTGWRVCRTQADLMPEAWAAYQKDFKNLN